MTTVRPFASGANRDTDLGKNDYEGFLSPWVLERYGDYMTRHRVLPDGSLRDSDNWQLGIPPNQYMKSLIRHVFHLWKLHRQVALDREEVKDACCAVMFNVMGYLHEELKPLDQPRRHKFPPPSPEELLWKLNK